MEGLEVQAGEAVCGTVKTCPRMKSIIRRLWKETCHSRKREKKKENWALNRTGAMHRVCLLLLHFAGKKGSLHREVERSERRCKLARKGGGTAGMGRGKDTKGLVVGWICITTWRALLDRLSLSRGHRDRSTVYLQNCHRRSIFRVEH